MDNGRDSPRRTYRKGMVIGNIVARLVKDGVLAPKHHVGEARDLFLCNYMGISRQGVSAVRNGFKETLKNTVADAGIG
jgi:hypothetical protein